MKLLKDIIIIFGLLKFSDYIFIIYNFIREVIPLGYSYIFKLLINMIFDYIKDISIIQEYLNKEKSKFANDLDKDIKTKARSIGNKIINYKLPKVGMSYDNVMNFMIEQSKIEDLKWTNGKLSGSIYNGNKDHINFINQAFNLYSVANILHLNIWPSGLKYESEIISMTANLLNNDDEDVCGCTTSGGTESIILAIKAHRDYYRKKYNILYPEMIKCISGHPAVDKACDLLGIKLIKVPMNLDTFQVDVEAVTNSITSNTILIYSSAPTYPHGVIDPITELGAIASYYEIGLHVDCCLGGFILPFAKKLGYDIPPFDFSVKGVTTISCDTHKYGYALKGTSVLLFCNAELRRAQYFCYPDWPGGFYTTATIAGSRSGGMIAQTWATLVTIGEEGYLNYTKGIMESTKALANGIINNFPELQLIGGAKAMIICIKSNPNYLINGNTLNIYTLSDIMLKKGWILQNMHSPSCFHYCVTVKNTGMEKLFLNDLRISITELIEEMNAGIIKLQGNAAVYGMAQSMPNGPVAEFLTLYNDNILGKL